MKANTLLEQEAVDGTEKKTLRENGICQSVFLASSFPFPVDHWKMLP